MKRVLILVLCGLLFSGYAYAAALTRNASPVIVTLDSTTTYRNITFPFQTDNLNIINGDANDAIWVDVTSASNTNDIGKCFLVPAGETLDLYNFATDGISILRNTTYLGSGNGIASPVSVIATY